MKSLMISLAGLGLLLLFLAPGGLCHGCGTLRVCPSGNITVTYTVVDGVSQTFRDSTPVTVPKSSAFFFNVMEAARNKNPSKFNFTYSLSVYGAYITSVRGLQANDTQRTYWQLLSNSKPLNLGAGCYAVSRGERLEVRFSKY